MTAPIDPELKRLRRLKPGELADEAGALKARIADLEKSLGRIKTEAIRRELLETEGALFRLLMVPPGVRKQLDRDRLLQDMGQAFVDKYSIASRSGWKMLVNARVRSDSQASAPA